MSAEELLSITMQAQREAPPDMQCKDKFLVQSMIAPSSKDVSQEMFNKEEGKDVHKAKLKVVYVSPPQPPSPIIESNEEGNSPKASTPLVDNGERHHILRDPQMTVKTESEWKFKLNEAKNSLSALNHSLSIIVIQQSYPMTTQMPSMLDADHQGDGGSNNSPRGSLVCVTAASSRKHRSRKSLIRSSNDGITPLEAHRRSNNKHNHHTYWRVQESRNNGIQAPFKYRRRISICRRIQAK